MDDLPVPQATLDHACSGLDSVQIPYPSLKGQPLSYSCPRYLVCCNGAAYSRGCTNCVADNQPIQLCEYSPKQAVYNRTSGACVPWWVGAERGWPAYSCACALAISSRTSTTYMHAYTCSQCCSMCMRPLCTCICMQPPVYMLMHSASMCTCICMQPLCTFIYTQPPSTCVVAYACSHYIRTGAHVRWPRMKGHYH